MNTAEKWHGTTIVLLRKNGETVVAGDGQVSLGNTVLKSKAKKDINITALERKLSNKLGIKVVIISNGKKGTLSLKYSSLEQLDSLLNKAGWKTIAVGFIEDFNNIKYSTYNSDNLWKIPITECKRNTDTGLVDYFRNNKFCASLPTGLAARPLWYCESIQ